MQLTAHSDYALRVLLYLYVHDEEPVGVSQIAQAYDISANHLAKVAQTLSRAGWLKSQRGRGGGLMLDPSAYEITVGDVIRLTERNRNIVECFNENHTCKIEPGCGLKFVLREAADAFLAVLDEYRLEHLVRNPKRIRTLLTTSATKG